jgi:hypothetical protein
VFAPICLHKCITTRLFSSPRYGRGLQQRFYTIPRATASSNAPCPQITPVGLRAWDGTRAERATLDHVVLVLYVPPHLEKQPMPDLSRDIVEAPPITAELDVKLVSELVVQGLFLLITRLADRRITIQGARLGSVVLRLAGAVLLLWVVHHSSHINQSTDRLSRPTVALAASQVSALALVAAALVPVPTVATTPAAPPMVERFAPLESAAVPQDSAESPRIIACLPTARSATAPAMQTRGRLAAPLSTSPGPRSGASRTALIFTTAGIPGR